jgi:hypothetical protein
MAININVENYNSNTYYTGENFSGATDFNFTNPADSTSYVIFQTISIDGKYTSVSPKNFLGTITNSTVVNTVVSPYVLAIVLPPGTSTFTFTPDTAVTGTTYNFRVLRRGAFQPNPPPSPTPSVDPDAEAFLTAAAITDATITSAVDTLVTDLKTANIWTKMKAIYPMVGGSATTHKWNLKDPLDTDAAFRLSFVGGWTHSSTGALPNGTNGYANTFLNANTGLQQFSHHHAFYHNTNNSGIGLRSMGGAQTSASVNFRTTIESNGTTLTFRDLGIINSETGLTATTLKGFRASSRTANNNIFIVKADGTSTTSTTSTAANALPALTCYVGAHNASGTAGNYAIMSIAFHSIGDGLSAAEGLSLRNAVETFQTTLGRQV